MNPVNTPFLHAVEGKSITRDRILYLTFVTYVFQLEDTEFARMAAVKAKQNIELEVADLQQQLDDTLKNKSDLEDRMLRINREKTDLSRYY